MEDGIKETQACTIPYMKGIIYGDNFFKKASFLSVVLPILFDADAFHGSQGIRTETESEEIFLTLPDSLKINDAGL